MRRILLVILLSATTAALPGTAHAERAPKRGVSDPRVRSVVYKDDDVVRLDASYGVSMMITFGDGELIDTITLGDTVAWQVVPNKKRSMVFIKPVSRDAETNMNIVTNRHIYTFELTTDVGKGKTSQIYKVRFIYPEDDYDAKLMEQAAINVAAPNLGNLDVANMNSDYAYKGDDSLAPVAIFDDGVKTFFKLRGTVPAIFEVDPKRHETLVNSRREGEFVVVDGVNRQWTLRNGAFVTCVYNLRANRPAPDPSADAIVAPRKLDDARIASAEMNSR